MLRSVPIILLLGLLVNPLVLSAEKDASTGDLGSAIGKVASLMTLNQTMLYGSVAAYHAKFSRWPAGKDELIAALSEGMVEAKAGAGDDPVQILQAMDMTFTDAGDGTLLIEARYSDQLEEEFAKGGFGKFRTSAVVSVNGGDYIFTPSAYRKNDRDYFTASAKLRLGTPTP